MSRIIELPRSGNVVIANRDNTEYSYTVDVYADDDTMEFGRGPEEETDDEARHRVITAMAKKFDVKFTCVDEHGPAGGNPVVEFYGEPDKMRKFVAWFENDTTVEAALL